MSTFPFFGVCFVPLFSKSGGRIEGHLAPGESTAVQAILVFQTLDVVQIKKKLQPEKKVLTATARAKAAMFFCRILETASEIALV